MISDWSLLLYGTSEPAQPSDPRHSVNPQAHRFKPNAHSQNTQHSLTSQVSFLKLNTNAIALI